MTAAPLTMNPVEMRVGDLTLVGLNDGEFTMKSDFLGAAAHRLLAGADGEVHLPIATFYLPGDEALLIDAGMGPDDTRSNSSEAASSSGSSTGSARPPPTSATWRSATSILTTRVG